MLTPSYPKARRGRFKAEDTARPAMLFDQGLVERAKIRLWTIQELAKRTQLAEPWTPAS